MIYLITGSAGFIGFNLSRTLLETGHKVVGIDMVNDYYDVNLKEARLDILKAFDQYVEERIDMADRAEVERVFKENKPECVINLAAQAGVRYSIENPYVYADSNLLGFCNILESARLNDVKHFMFASSSSVYGGNKLFPLAEKNGVGHPMSIYAATKRANEVIAHSYAHLFGMPCTGLRFFTVYGPWGRPDMALFKFTKNILEDKPIDVFNNGDMKRDFTYIDDVVGGVIAVSQNPPVADTNVDMAAEHPSPDRSPIGPFRVYNIGRGEAVSLMTYIETLEKELGKKAIYNMLPMQPGDVSTTSADISNLKNDIGYKPSVSVDEGVRNFVKWYKDYYKVA